MVEPSLAALLAAADGGDRSALDALFATLYSELHRLARRQLSRGAGPMTLGTTTLLHEAYLDMAEREGGGFPDRGRFMAYAARVMRGLIIDYIRHRRAQKRGGQFEMTTLETSVSDSVAQERELTELSDALDELASIDAALAEIVDLKFFCGFSFVEIAAMRAVSERTVQRQWEKARIYLHGVLRDSHTLS